MFRGCLVGLADRDQRSIGSGVSITLGYIADDESSERMA